MKLDRKKVFLGIFIISLCVLVGRFVWSSMSVHNDSQGSDTKAEITSDALDDSSEKCKFTLENPMILMPKKKIADKVDYAMIRIESFKNDSDQVVDNATFVIAGWDKNGVQIPVYGYKHVGELDGGLIEITFKKLNLAPGEVAGPEKLLGPIGLSDNADVKKIRVICKKVTFENGDVWDNPYYQDWVNKYSVVSE